MPRLDRGAPQGEQKTYVVVRRVDNRGDGERAASAVKPILIPSLGRRLERLGHSSEDAAPVSNLGLPEESGAGGTTGPPLALPVHR